jgi:Rps23 Pro-64 3,4-dihydroxylase Tpa1-like proline 4-hydroxylase
MARQFDPSSVAPDPRSAGPLRSVREVPLFESNMIAAHCAAQLHGHGREMPCPCEQRSLARRKSSMYAAETNMAIASDDLNQVLAGLRPRLYEVRSRWNAAVPFHYVVIDQFLPMKLAERIHDSYPTPAAPGWEWHTKTHSRKKLTMRAGFPSAIEAFFQISATAEFRELLHEMTSIPQLLHDPELVGGGLHQILRGGFLDVHIDYNFHPGNKLHRRLNLLVYLNREWSPEFGGYLELWDWTPPKRRIENIAPVFNRAVIFETNEVSFHGHPVALTTDLPRKSLALYYYTEQRDGAAPEHNTIYRQTTGLRGYLKTTAASARAAADRFRQRGAAFVVLDLAAKARRKALGEPPPNR